MHDEYDLFVDSKLTIKRAFQPWLLLGKWHQPFRCLYGGFGLAGGLFETLDRGLRENMFGFRMLNAKCHTIFHFRHTVERSDERFDHASARLDWKEAHRDKK